MLSNEKGSFMLYVTTYLQTAICHYSDYVAVLVVQRLYLNVYHKVGDGDSLWPGLGTHLTYADYMQYCRISSFTVAKNGEPLIL